MGPSELPRRAPDGEGPAAALQLSAATHARAGRACSRKTPAAAVVFAAPCPIHHPETNSRLSWHSTPEKTLQLILEATVHRGQTDAFRELARTARSLERTEPGTLDYRWVMDESGTHVRFLDTYASSEAFVTHIEAATASGLLDKIMALVDVTGASVVGAPSAAARKILDGFGAVYFTQVGGYNRLHAPAAPAR